MITATIILCATLMILWSGTMMLWLGSDKPLVQVTVQIAVPQWGQIQKADYGRA